MKTRVDLEVIDADTLLESKSHALTFSSKLSSSTTAFTPLTADLCLIGHSNGEVALIDMRDGKMLSSCQALGYSIISLVKISDTEFFSVSTDYNYDFARIDYWDIKNQTISLRKGTTHNETSEYRSGQYCAARINNKNILFATPGWSGFEKPGFKVSSPTEKLRDICSISFDSTSAMTAKKDRLITATHDGKLHVWKVDTEASSMTIPEIKPEFTFCFPEKKPIISLTTSPNDNVIACMDDTGKISYWDFSEKKLLKDHNQHIFPKASEGKEFFQCLSATPNGGLFVYTHEHQHIHEKIGIDAETKNDVGSTNVTVTIISGSKITNNYTNTLTPYAWPKAAVELKPSALSSNNFLTEKTKRQLPIATDQTSQTKEKTKSCCFVM